MQFKKLSVFLGTLILLISFCIVALHAHEDCADEHNCAICAIMQNASAGHTQACFVFLLFIICVLLPFGQKYAFTFSLPKHSRAPPLFLQFARQRHPEKLSFRGAVAGY
jgi:Na+-transporting NADH:ubiquinone oxidoreductase subunit NqrD